MGEVKLNTKDHLLQVAGELFAKLGYEAVSTRMIAEQADVKLSGIHYHYGSKENLYRAAVTFAAESDNCADFSSVIAENPGLLETDEGLAEIIRTTVFRSFFDNFTKENKSEWMRQLLIREVVTPSSVFSIIHEVLVKSDIEASHLIIKRVRPNAEDSEVIAWLDLLHSQIFMYVMAKDALELIRGEGSLDGDFYRQAARVVSRAMILELGLPLPNDLR